MTDKVKTKRRKPETQARDLTPNELEQVSAGTSFGGSLVALGDGSVRIVDTADYVIWRKTFGPGV